MNFSEEISDEILKIFQVESEEIISKINDNLLSLEKSPKNKEIILLLFRDAHSLKGASRMIGFNNVQTIAHKMEDILGLAKEDKISLNSKIVNILYKTVDFLSELIQKSIKKKQEIYNEEIPKHLKTLEDINELIEESDEEDNSQIQDQFNTEIFKKNLNKINNLISESLFILMKMEEEEKETNLIKDLLKVINDLYDIFKTTNSFDLKKYTEDIKVKLEFTSKASNSLTASEIGEIHNILNNIINIFVANCELYNLEIVDYYSKAFEKMQRIQEEDNIQIQEPEILQSQSFAEKVSQDIDLIKEKIEDLLQNTASAEEVTQLIQNYKTDCNNENIDKILQKIIEILDFVSKNEATFNEEIISSLKESIEYCDNLVQNKTSVADSNLILNRLEIIQQVLSFDIDKIQQEVIVNTQQPKQITDFSEVFNTGAIKTLRVDSTKLDTLINQVNELTISKIKTKKHLFELNIVNKQIEEWQKIYSKAINYLKYYERKHSQFDTSDNTSSIIKHLLNLFSDNSKKIQTMSSDIIKLHRTIQEDDTKMSLIVENINNMVRNIRILPLATVFHLFGRMVRDIAQEKNKKINFQILGSETSADKKIIEEIKAPLIHIIRNSIDHGIEPPEEREAVGKPPTGEIILSARQSSNKVIIEVKDDGRGINLEKIKEKALSKGFLTQEEIASMTEEQLTNLIFAPGFSTGDEITDISGRGIGLDVVFSKISQLNGKVKVVSEFNRGCCVQIELPTTMSILKVFLVKASGQMFAVPMDTINTVLRKRNDEIITTNKKKSIIFKKEPIPLYNLSDILNLPKDVAKKDKKTIIIIESDNKIIALNVDKLYGEQEILIKKLSAPFYKLKNISGITTLISGKICLVLNIPDIINSTQSKKIETALIEKAFNSNDYKILLVDDSSTTRVLEKNILTQAGYNIELAENPIEAFKKMQNINFDLIISDIEMPEMDGLDFLKKIKSNEKFVNIPVIMVSSLMNGEKRSIAMALGAEKYIIKGDFNQEDFQDSIREILKKYK